MLIKPAPGKAIRNPASRLLIPETGLEVTEHDTYWARRLADGDVVEVKPTVSSTKATAPKAKE